jgi:hypothetical protein
MLQPSLQKELESIIELAGEVEQLDSLTASSFRIEPSYLDFARDWIILVQII